MKVNFRVKTNQIFLWFPLIVARWVVFPRADVLAVFSPKIKDSRVLTVIRAHTSSGTRTAWELWRRPSRSRLACDWAWATAASMTVRTFLYSCSKTVMRMETLQCDPRDLVSWLCLIPGTEVFYCLGFHDLFKKMFTTRI